MAMQAAISVVMLSLNQNLTLQGISIAKFNTTLPFHEAGSFEELENPVVTPTTSQRHNNHPHLKENAKPKSTPMQEIC